VWAISDLRFGFPLYLALLYPLTIMMATAVAIFSVIFALTGRSTWKGRTLFEPKVKMP
jgi:hypothetical protein